MIVICTESVSRFLHVQVALVSYMEPIDIQSETSSCQPGYTSYWVSVNIVRTSGLQICVYSHVSSVHCLLKAACVCWWRDELVSLIVLHDRSLLAIGSRRWKNRGLCGKKNTHTTTNVKLASY